MSRKKKKARPTKPGRRKPSALAAPPAFPVGAQVRVKAGTLDPDFPDMPLGGWAGTIVQVDPAQHGSMYLIEWNAYTLLHMHPVFRARCDREDLNPESSWLDEAELELDPGGLVRMEQPQALTTLPLDPKRVDDRIRAIFNLTTNDSLPPLDDASLRHIYDHLVANLPLPMSVTNAELDLNGPPDLRNLTLVELVPPGAGEIEDELGAVVTIGDSRAEVPLSHLEPKRDDGSARLLRDYAYWIWEGSDYSPIFVQPREQGSQEPDEVDDDLELLSPGRVVFNAVSRCGLYGAAAGAAVGAEWAALDHVPFAMGVGAVVVAVIGYIVGTRYGFFFGKVNRINSGPILGGILGMVGGAVLGAVAGALVIAYYGTIIGSIAGAIVGYLFRLVSQRLPGKFFCGVVGTLLGAIVAAWYADGERTLYGLLWGTTAGAATGLVLAAAFFGMLIWLAKTPEEQG